MVSWDIKVKFLGVSPNIKELQKLAREQGFSNIEEIKWLEVNDKCESTYLLIVNDRGLNQETFKAEIVG